MGQMGALSTSTPALCPAWLGLALARERPGRSLALPRSFDFQEINHSVCNRNRGPAFTYSLRVHHEI